MEKTKLKNRRLSLNITQQKLADYIATDKTNYCKKEKGVVKITDEEWEKLAKFLSCELEDIYEKDDNQILINSLNSIGSNNVYNAYNELAQETLRKYITKLEDEVESLKEEVKQLKSL